MKSFLLVSLLLTLPGSAAAGEGLVGKLTLLSPQDYQVFQRKTASTGDLLIAGSLSFPIKSVPAEIITLQGRLAGAASNGPLAGAWLPLPFDVRVAGFQSRCPTPAGGWYRLEVRALVNNKTIAEAHVDHVGIGDVFVVAGQSNAANYGEKLTKTMTLQVAAHNGRSWAPAQDPVPGASGKGGSFMPAFGDALHAKTKVPIGLVATAVGSTSVRQWLPRGERLTRLPTRTDHIASVGPEAWVCTGELFDNLTKRIQQLGPDGLRAVLWHQGESDGNQAMAERTLSGKDYRDHLERIIRESRRRAGWEVPWLVALASYHGPQDAGSPEIRAGQKSLWTDGLALEGPDTDALTGIYRERAGQGVHMSAVGLEQHGLLWAEKVLKHFEP